MGRVLFVGLIGAAMTGTAQAGVMDFDAFDANRWSEGSDTLGRSRLDPANVGVSGGNLQIKLPARATDGGEIFSNDLYGQGSYTARMKLPNAPSSIAGFFLYEPPDYASEIDVEIHNDSSKRMAIYSTYANGSQTHTENVALPFDPTDGFHEYRFEYASGSSRFYADGQFMKEWSEGAPQSSMRIYANAWYPSRLDGRKSNRDKYVLIDGIQHLRQ